MAFATAPNNASIARIAAIMPIIFQNYALMGQAVPREIRSLRARNVGSRRRVVALLSGSQVVTPTVLLRRMEPPSGPRMGPPTMMRRG